MPIYTISATAVLATELNPDGYLRSSEISDLEDESYYSYRELDYELEFNFSVEADDEETARLEAERIVQTVRFETHGGPEWEVVDPEISEITLVIEPINLQRAVEILREWTQIPSHAAARERRIAVNLTPEIMQALDFAIAYMVSRDAVEQAQAVVAA